MPRVQSDLKNQWGIKGGANPQRSDLWQVDLEPAITEINTLNATLNAATSQPLRVLPRYIPSSIALPELKVRAEAFRRDSKSYNMPSWDEPLEAVRITFVMDDGTMVVNRDSLGQSEVYRFLDAWRRLTRAGRGELGHESAILLSNDYKMAFRFPIYAYLLRGYAMPPVAVGRQNQSRFTRPNSSTMTSTFDVPIALAPPEVRARVESNQAGFTAGLEITNVLHLENAWLGGFKVSDMNYEAARVMTIEANFYAENIFQFQSGKLPSSTL